MKRKGLLCWIFVIAGSPLLVQAQPSDGELKERLSTWKGEKVIFRHRYCDSTPELEENIRGKTGIISGIVWIENKPEITIKVDGSDRIVKTASVYCLGFFSEKELLEKLAGRTLWSKGYLTDSAGNLPPLTKFTVRRLEWSWGILEDMNLVLTTDQGREVGLALRVPVRPCVMSRFCEKGNEKPWELVNEFFEQDPKVLHRDWSADVFALIAEGTVAQGMSVEMVNAACGRFLTKTGALVSEGKTFPTYTCNGYDFVIDGGKVTMSKKKGF